jgi:hypothetical protein
MAQIKIVGGSITDNVVGFSVPKGSDLSLELTQVATRGNGTFFEERDEPSLFEKLGVPEEHRHEFLALIKVLATKGTNSREAVQREVEQSTLRTLLGDAVDITTLVSNLTTIGASFGFPALVTALSKGLGGC